ncbi:hypothetical protein [Caulobacter soli]|uniref:hypothetical protein n=1 Tax=Caulobacter soli TaxID=2708539 RepID=UPI0013E9D612|nr:hypothetical protein [Caulobacter soli]
MSTHEEGWIDPKKDAAHVEAVLAQGGFKVAVADPAYAQRLQRALEGPQDLALPAPMVAVEKSRQIGLTEATRLCRSDEDAPAVPPPCSFHAFAAGQPGAEG